VGGTPQSFTRAGTLGLPLMVAIIAVSSGASVRWSTSTARRGAGHAPELLKVGIHATGFVAETAGEARDVFYAG
jgi:alkanesulfonate monooxygenase SsuD/methylene tetrahydromethanopterin reductase-like flavin-dependent oxidoreductase (luciferase family)